MIADVLGRNAPSGIVCLLGIGGNHTAPFDIGQFNRAMVFNNDVVFGSVNANRRHYEMALAALGSADQAWLERLISRRVPLSNWQERWRTGLTISKWSLISGFRHAKPGRPDYSAAAK